MSFPSIGQDHQAAKFFAFSETIAGTSFTSTAFVNLAERLRLTNVVLNAASHMVIEGLLNRVQHATAGITVFGRVELSASGFTSRYSNVVSIGTSFDVNYKQMILSSVFLSVPAGTYNLEVQLRVASGTCHLYDDVNGAGTRSLRAIVVSI